MVEPKIKFLIPAYLHLLSTNAEFRETFAATNAPVAAAARKFADDPIRKGARLPAHAHQLVAYFNHHIRFFTELSSKFGDLFDNAVSELNGGAYETEFRQIAQSAETKAVAEDIAKKFFAGDYPSNDPFYVALDLAYQSEIEAAGGASCKGCKLNAIKRSFTDKVKTHIASKSV